MKIDILDKDKVTLEMMSDENIFVLSGNTRGQFGKTLGAQRITPEYYSLFNKTQNDPHYEFVKVIDWGE